MRVLITNDDGIGAPGIRVLAEAVRAEGHEAIVAAPRGERSGSGAAIGHLGNGTEIEVDAADIGLDVSSFGVDGPPACCVLLAFMEVFGPKPDLIMSGINPGANTGRGLLHSGTVGAVLSGADFGISGAAISQEFPFDGGPQLFDTAAHVARATLRWLIDQPRKTAANVNVPNVAVDQLKGFRWGRISAFGTTSTSMVGDVPGIVTVSVAPRDVVLKPDTDTALVGDGFVSITTLVTPRPTEPFMPSTLDELLASITQSR